MTGNDTAHLDVLGQAYSFGVVKAAQARDFGVSRSADGALCGCILEARTTTLNDAVRHSLR